MEEAETCMEEVTGIAVDFLREVEDLQQEDLEWMGEMEDYQKTGEEE
jgi:hypothetical protein